LEALIVNVMGIAGYNWMPDVLFDVLFSATASGRSARTASGRRVLPFFQAPVHFVFLADRQETQAPKSHRQKILAWRR
jgi:hypothetical protein